MKNWHCYINNQTWGPYPENLLRELIDKGQLTADTLVYNDSPEEAPKGWQRAGDTEIAALFLNNSQGTQPHSSNNAYEPGRCQFEEETKSDCFVQKTLSLFENFSKKQIAWFVGSIVLCIGVAVVIANHKSTSSFVATATSNVATTNTETPEAREARLKAEEAKAEAEAEAEAEARRREEARLKAEEAKAEAEAEARRREEETKQKKLKAEWDELSRHVTMYSDEIENDKTIFDKTTPTNAKSGRSIPGRNNFFIYLTLIDNSIYPRLFIGFQRSGWVFMENIIINVDGNVYTINVPRFENTPHSGLKTDIIGGGLIQEYVDFYAIEYENIIKAIGNGKKVLVRYKGDKHYHDVQLSDTQKAALKRMYRMYEVYEAYHR
jgi:hypothetical protein